MEIRSEQMTALGATHEASFLDRLVKLVAGGKGAGGPDAPIRQKCAELKGRAARYGLATEFEVATFVLCGFKFGPDFDQQDQWPFRRILQEPGAAARLKAAQMAVVLDQLETRKTARRQFE